MAEEHQDSFYSKKDLSKCPYFAAEMLSESPVVGDMVEPNTSLLLPWTIVQIYVLSLRKYRIHSTHFLLQN